MDETLSYGDLPPSGLKAVRFALPLWLLRDAKDLRSQTTVFPAVEAQSLRAYSSQLCFPAKGELYLFLL